MNDLRALLPYVRQKPRPPPMHSCEMCGVEIAEQHRHVVDLRERKLRCACRSCAVLFDQDGGPFRRVPDRVLCGPPIAAGKWAALGVPVRLAFVFFDSRLSRWCASYPSVAGAIESEVAADGWEELAREHPLLREIAPDVEALLVWGPIGARELECFLVPIDACYELSGLCRTHWRGFHGGDEMKSELDAFFARLRSRAGAAR